MTLEELKDFCENTLHTVIEFPLPQAKGYGMIHSPADDSLAGLVMYNDVMHTIDLKYEEKLKADQKGPFILREPGWIGFDLDDHRNDKIIKDILEKRCLAGKKPISKIEQQLLALREMYDPAKTQAENFYRQGRFLEDVDDVYRTDVPLDDAKPHYHKMSDAQLRCYLTLRKQYRMGLFPRTCSNYVFLFVFEVLNQIGIKNKREGQNILRQIRMKYYHQESARKRLTDYLRAYDAIYFKDGSMLFKRDDEAALLGNLDPLNKVSPMTFGHALARYTQIRWSSLYDRDPTAYLSLLQKIWGELNKQIHFFTYYVAKRVLTSFDLLDGVYFGYPVKDKRIPLGGENLVNRNGHWYLEGYQGYQNQELLRSLVSVYDAQLSGGKGENRCPSDVAAIIEKYTSPMKIDKEQAIFEKMRQLYDPLLSKAENFYRQGKYMETFTCYYNRSPKIYDSADYQMLNDFQLRGYFAWRTCLRRGIYKNVDYYIHFYVTEIINGIGVRNAHQGFDVLRDLKTHFPAVYYLDRIIQEYAAVNELKDHFDLVNPFNQCVYDLDPRHLGSEKEILRALHLFNPRFGKKNCLYRGNEVATDHFLVQAYKAVVKDDDSFQKYVADDRTVYFTPYQVFIYFERRKKDAVIHLDRHNVLEFKHDQAQWCYHGYYSHGDQLNYLNAAFNKCISEKYGFKGSPLPKAAKPLYERLKPFVNKYLDEHPLKNASPQVKHRLFSVIQMKFDEIRNIKAENRYDRFMRQARSIEGLSLEVRPFIMKPLILVQNYDSLNKDTFLTYIYERTRWQTAGTITATDVDLLMFLPLYANEVINDIGVKDTAWGLAMCESIENANRYLAAVYLDKTALYHISFDYRLTHQLECGEEFKWQVAEDQKIMALHPLYTTDPHLFFEHLSDLETKGGYHLKSSPLYKSDPVLFEKLVYDVFKALMDKHEEILAKHIREKYKLYDGLMYPDPPVHFASYVISPIRQFEQGEDGQIYYDHYLMVSSLTPFKEVIRETDAWARDYLQSKRKLRHRMPNAKSQIVAQIVKKELTKLRQEEKKKAEISIQFEALNKIREDAKETTEQLITDAEKEDHEEHFEINEDADEPTRLSDDEKHVLSLLLRKQDINDYVSSHHLLASVMIDAINEKLFDEIGDNVIAFDGDQPAVIDDYREDIEEIMNRQRRTGCES